MRIIPWADPFTNEPLEETDTHLIHKNSKYPIIDGIPKFVQSESNDEQYKIQKCFSYQWTKSDFGQTEQEIKDWCTEFNLTPKLIKENYSGFTCHAFRE